MAKLIRRNALATTVAVFGLALGLLVLLILSLAHRNIVNKVEEDLTTGIRVFERLLEDRNDQLASHVRLLADDLRFQQAIAKHALTRNDQDVLRWLQVHQNSTNADVGWLVDMDGRTLPAIRSDFQPSELVSRLAATPGEQEVRLLINLDGRSYQVVFAPLQRGNWRAWVGIGFELDEAFLDVVRSASGADVSLLTKHGSEASWLSTLPPQLRTQPGLGSSVAELSQALQQEGWQSRSLLLESVNGSISPVVSTSITDEYQNFATLRRLLVSGALLGLILVALTTLWLRRELDKALQSFAAAVQNIAQGEYNKPVTLAPGKRSGWIESALSKVQRAVQEREHRFNFHVRHDPVTGLPNKHYVETQIRARLAEEEERPLLMLIVQVRRLNQLRHIYGTDLGEELIKRTAIRSQALLAANDIIGRLEDDQFLLYLDSFREEQLSILRQQLANLYRRPIVIEQTELHLDVAVGAVLSFGKSLDYPDLLRRCKLALSYANSKQSAFELYRKGQDDIHLRRARISYSIPRAVLDNEFTLVYQPQLNLKHNRVERVEALLRWQSSKLGALSPGEFIPLAERSGQIGTISCWLISSVVEQLKRWQQEGLFLNVSINLSAHDLVKDEVIQHLARSLEMAALPPSSLTLEVTESTMIQQPEKTILTLQHLHQQGFKLAMDDFGTGFSSLSQIKALPLQELKIDKSFVLNLDRDRDDQSIVRAAIHMAHRLGLEVVAEGVENPESLNLLQSLSCDGIQGNLLARPMKNDELESWLLKHERHGPEPRAETGSLQQGLG